MGLIFVKPNLGRKTNFMNVMILLGVFVVLMILNNSKGMGK